MIVKLMDPVLDASDPQTRLLLLAEYWKRKYQEVCATRHITPSNNSTAREVSAILATKGKA